MLTRHFPLSPLIEGLPSVFSTIASWMPVITTETAGIPDFVENEQRLLIAGNSLRS